MIPGTILLHKNFVFADGAKADKYLVVLAENPSVLLVAKTTSKGHRYRNDHGCQAGNQYPAFLLTLGCCCLTKNSWVCLSEFYEIGRQQLYAKIVAASVFKTGLLTPDLTKDVQTCAAGSDDVTKTQEAMIRAHL